MLSDRVIQVCVLGWINAVDAACEDGDGPGLKARPMGFPVNAGREPRHNSQAGLPQAAREIARQLSSSRRRVACADNADGGFFEQARIAQHANHGRRWRKLGQKRRKRRLHADN